VNAAMHVMYESVPVPRIVVERILQFLACSIHLDAIDQLMDLPRDIQLIDRYGSPQEHGIIKEEEGEVKREELSRGRGKKKKRRQCSTEDEVVCNYVEAQRFHVSIILTVNLLGWMLAELL
jgi:hypothetical protein